MDEKLVYLTVKDHSVSNEEFDLIYNQKLDLLETSPQPKEEDLPSYYKSEDYISHTDSKRNWFEKLYHIIKSIALKRKLKLINSFENKSGLLLDVGCGTGDFLQTAKNDGWKVTGIEPNEHARVIANQKTGAVVYDVDQLPKFKKNQFDVITLWHVLEHLPNLEAHLNLFSRLLKPNGTLVIAVPNFKSYDAAYYKSFWAAYDAPRHLWHFSKNSIERLISNLSLKLIQTQPLTFDAYYVALLSEKYKNGFMNPFKAFWVGWLSNRKAKASNEYSSMIYIIKKH